MEIKIVAVLSLWFLFCDHFGKSANGHKLWGSRRSLSSVRARDFNRTAPSAPNGPRKSLRQPLRDTKEGPMAVTGDGIIQGNTMETVKGRVISAFQSIPYAEPPIGSRRFQDPVKIKKWNGTLKALQPSPQCVQVDSFENNQIHGQEDCLYLNVYAPRRSPVQRSKKPYPVIVYIHGGAYYFGGSHYGPRYLLDHDIVLVTVSYRLGPFGFFSTEDDASPGNQGLKDQVLALKWVQTNIAAFGGNPKSVTVVGAASTMLHILSPASRGLFHRAIAQSGSPFCYWSRSTNAAELAARVGGLFKCSRNSTLEMVECLRGIPAAELTTVQLQLTTWTGPLVLFGPTVEHNHTTAFITKSPEQYYQDGEAAPVTLIAGVNNAEGSWRTLLQMNDTDHIDQLNEDWDEIGPAFLDMYDTITEEEQQQRLRKIWKFYMGDKPLSWETRREFSQLFGDRNIVACTLEGMRYHSLYTKQPVYGYHFTYQGRHSILQKLGGNPADWGVSHIDELIYLFNNTDHYPSLSEGDPEITMSEMMANIWTNFATFNTPYISKGGNNNSITPEPIWQPIQPATASVFTPGRFLELKLKPEMIKDPFEKRYNFWKETMDGQF